jgi:hypothetical protein
MTRYLLVTMMLLAAQLVNAQAADSTIIDESIPWKYGVSNASAGIHIMPFSIALKHPRIRIGGLVEAGRWEFVLDVEYGNRYTFQRNENRGLPYHFLGFRPEIRYSLYGNFLGFTDQYVAIEIPFNWVTKTVVNNYYEAGDTHYFFDRATYRRSRIALLFKTGITMPIGERFYIDYYAGIGAGQRTVRYDDQVNLQVSESSHHIRIWGFNQLQAEGTAGIVDFALGFRIGYILSQ